MSFDKDRLLDLIDRVEIVTTTGPGEMGWVYFIVCIDAPRCKIGFTKGCAQRRLKSLQTGSASELALVAMHPGTTDTERLLHEKFADSRLRGEWFEITDELRAYLVVTTWSMLEYSLRYGRKPEPWMIEGTIATLENLDTISEELAEALASA